MFTEKEIEYMKSQMLARIATVSEDGQPDASPVGSEIADGYIYVGGYNNPATRKYHNIADGNTLVAIVSDDLISVDPWRPRGIRVYGTADLVERDSYAGQGTYIQITPTVSWSWNVEDPAMEDGEFTTRRTVHN